MWRWRWWVSEHPFWCESFSSADIKGYAMTMRRATTKAQRTYAEFMAAQSSFTAYVDAMAEVSRTTEVLST